jgi:hypothetical protein
VFEQLRPETEGRDDSIASVPPIGAHPDRTVGPVPFGHSEGDDLAPLSGSPATASQETVSVETAESALRPRPPHGRVRGRLDRLKRGERWKRRLPEACR